MIPGHVRTESGVDWNQLAYVRVVLWLLHMSIHFSHTLVIERECEVLSNPANGQVNIIDSTATYTCDSGYELIGDDTRTCEDGVWTGEEPTCIGIIHIHIDTVCTPLISHL